VRNVIALARIAANSRPSAVIDVFARIQSVLKAIGDKHLVLEVADLCLEAANRMGIDENAARARALTLICGKSWVYQRIGRLDEAMIIARKSLEIGQAIAWPRNTAYCIKCIGRLLRLQAEKTPDKIAKSTLLRESEEHL